jgi:hypothetical protein
MKNEREILAIDKEVSREILFDNSIPKGSCPRLYSLHFLFHENAPLFAVFGTRFSDNEYVVDFRWFWNLGHVGSLLVVLGPMEVGND